VGTIPAGLEEFYNQQLDWQSCVPFNDSPDSAKDFSKTALECANLIVPLNYDDPGGPTITMAVLRSKATGADRIGALQMNPGGPGASGLQFVAQIDGDQESATLHQSFDFIGFDTRGVGASRPALSCQTDAEKDAVRAANYRTTTPEGIAALTGAVHTYVSQCVERTGKESGIDGAAFVVTMGTVDTIQDMDVLRSALGEEKMTYVGFSYGTLLGSMYAAKFPGSVRAMILDGAVDPNADPAHQDLGQATGFQGTFDAFAKWCAAQSSCALGADPGLSTVKYQQLTRPLLDKPLALKDGRVLTYADATTGTVLALYSDQNWDLLRTGLKNLQDGDGYVLMALADYYVERDTQGHYPNLLDVFNAVGCMDNERIDASKAHLEQYSAAAPFQYNGDPIAAIPTACSLWPGEPTRVRAPVSAPGVAPLVVISTTGDPATPYDDGVTLAKDLDASLITVEGSRHTAYLSAGISCVDDAGTDYLVDLTLPADGLTCQ
jgi:pimeloyl-ACP methyl ester carboxylesterase